MLAPTGVVFTIIGTKHSARMCDNFLLNRGVALQEVFQVVVVIEIPLAVDQLGIVT